MKQKEERKRWADFSDSIQHLVDENGFFINDDPKKKREFSEEDQIEELKRKRYRTPHEL